VDYVFVHETQREEFVAQARAYVAKHCPDINHVDYTSIIDDRSVQRLQDTLADAREKGATVINLCGNQEVNLAQRKFPLHLVLDTTPDMTIRNRETFGPLLMVLTYKEPGRCWNTSIPTIAPWRYTPLPMTTSWRTCISNASCPVASR
jgi:coniferyl-aldehyde dehydrogenase